ncbi:MAG: hypothetical protein A3K03_10675 [Bdellovibrionales bacterium RIFOXYD1_FULL_44_7]|nr:MAG: hypothetical protein A3K03_10675 [Bdellovibrionales bacterium RIFOXYD1_FULL_44_7]
MDFSESTQLMLVLSALAGAVHVLAPDHWLPASVLAWQRGWTFTKSSLFALFTFVIHLLAGVLIYFCFDSVLSGLQSTRLFAFSFILVFLVMTIRLLRFSRIKDIFRTGPRGLWAVFSVLSLIGPCESIIPILIKAKQMGIGYLLTILTFSLGTMIVGMASVVTGRYLWNRPLWLPRGISWSARGTALVPIAAGLAVGLSAILRIS